MIVMKFGGTVLKDAHGFRQMVGIVQGADHGLIVVSALSTTTRELQQAARLAADQQKESATAIIDTIARYHESLAMELITDTVHLQKTQRMIRELAREMETVLTGIAVTKQLTPRTLDRMMAFGEKLALELVTHVLQSADVDAKSLDARRCMVTTAAFGRAEPIASKTRVHVERELRPLLDAYPFVVMQGFVGATEEGETTTMGKESSNMSATLLASMIDATMVTIWTNVEGIRSIDPALVSTTLPRPAMSYAEAKHAAHHGLKLLYPTMIEPAEQAGIPIRIASAFEWKGASTMISAERDHVRPIVNVFNGPNDGMAYVSVVFVNVSQWTSALARAIDAVNEPDQCYVSSDPRDQVVTIRLPRTEAQALAVRLHEVIVLEQELSHETRP
jgi:aspartate kinase